MIGVIELIGILIGAEVLNFIGFWVFLKTNKRIKEAEASQQEFSYFEKRIDSLEKQVLEQAVTIKQLRHDYNIQEIKYYQKKGAIACADACTFVDNPINCPVKIKLQWFEDNYRKQLMAQSENEKVNL